jgi:hypothetical protein
MSNLFFMAAFSENGGDDPATGLTLAQIDLYLYRQNIATGLVEVVWNGSQNPDAEVPNIGMYYKILTGAELEIYHYHGGAQYTGATVLDANWVNGSVGGSVFPLGPVDFTYTMTEADLVTPIIGVEVFISRLNPTGQVQDAPIIWSGLTDSAGIAYDIEGNLPKLDVGTHYFWRQKTGYSFTDPDIENVSP